MTEQDTRAGSVPLPPAAELRQLITSTVVTQAIYVAAKLGIADKLADRPQSYDELAHALGVHPDALFRLLRYLASMGIFAQDQEGRFALTPLAACLQSSIPGSVRAWAIMWGEGWFWQPWGALLSSVRTGKPGFEQFHGMGLFEYLTGHAEAAQQFNEAMDALTVPVAEALVAAYDFAGVATVVDVGGGHGALLAAVLKAHPAMRGVLFDRPPVMEEARQFLTAQGVGDRCALVGGDFLTALPVVGDACLLKFILHVWDDAGAVTILKNCRRALGPQGKLLVVEHVLRPTNVPDSGKLMDVIMLAIPGGRERTEEEYRGLFRKAGFTLSRVVPTPSPLSIIEGVPVETAS